MRRTRIISTAGPACDSAAGIRALIDAGTDAFRLNASHGSRAWHAETYARIRGAARESGRMIAVLQDLSGPKIRIGAVAAPIELRAGEALAIEAGDFTGQPGRVSCSFDALFTSVPRGARLLLDDGRLELEVTEAAPARLETRVVVGGTLESHKGINVPGVVIRTAAMTAKDAEDLRAGIALGVDAVAISFVQSARDVTMVRAHAAAGGAADIPLIAKIEKPQAVAAIEEILDEADGVMVARGDLGIELPLETIPAVQKQVVQAARRRGVPVIVATQVLESMRQAPRPTRAEVTDAAHAVDEGADGVLLAGETAIGHYPELAVATLDRILREAEKTPAPPAIQPDEVAGWSAHGRALCEAAVALAARAGADAIVAVTEGGTTARMLSALRPRARILAVTPRPEPAARLVFVWGVTPLVAPTPLVEDVRRVLRDRGLVAPGRVVVFVSMDARLGDPDANFVHVEIL
jgi:pyruvate kinase